MMRIRHGSRKYFVVLFFTLVMAFGLSQKIFAQTSLLISYHGKSLSMGAFDDGQGYFDGLVNNSTKTGPSCMIIEKLSNQEKQAVQNVVQKIWSDYDVEPGDIFMCTFYVGRKFYFLYYLDKGEKYIYRLLLSLG
jgi:hypothetical protein